MTSSSQDVVGITGGVSQQDNTIYIDFHIPKIGGGSDSHCRSYDANLDKLISKFIIGIQKLSNTSLTNRDDVQFYLENIMIMFKNSHINWLAFSRDNCGDQLRHNCNLIRAFLTSKKDFNIQRGLRIIGALNALDNLENHSQLHCKDTIILQDSNVDLVKCAKLIKKDLESYCEILPRHKNEMHKAYNKMFDNIHGCLNGCE